MTLLGPSTQQVSFLGIPHCSLRRPRELPPLFSGKP